jgi:hypothetical protein
MSMFPPLLKRSPMCTEPDALDAMGQHASKIGIAVGNDLWAYKQGQRRTHCGALKIDALQEYQKASSKTRDTYLTLGRLSENGKAFEFPDMFSLWQVHGDAHLFRTVFASDDMCNQYFGPVAPMPDLQVHVEICMVRALVLAANFLFASAALRKGYLVKLFKPGLSEQEKVDFTALREGARNAAIAAINKVRPVSFNSDRFDAAARTQLETFVTVPVTLQVKAEFCTLSNKVWLESDHVKQLLSHAAQSQAAAFTLWET